MQITEKIRAKLASSEGFTLLEILVVLTIMGFLIAMVAPRLAGVSGSAVDTVCDTNQNRMVTYMSAYFEQTSRFPNKLTNLVAEDVGGASAYVLPSVSNQDPDDGAETFAAEFQERNKLQVHFLTANEASDLKNMGIVSILNLNSYDNLTVTAEAASMNPVIPAAGVGVAMSGMSATTAGVWSIAPGEHSGWGEPDFMGRIVLGMSAESGLITDGVISNAAHCPGGLQNADNATYNDYNLVLPRLQSTVDAFDATITGMDSDSTTDGVQVAAVAYDENWEPTADYAIAGNANNYRSRVFTLEAQENWQFGTVCPEGHMYPEDDGEFWAIDTSNDGNINF